MNESNSILNRLSSSESTLLKLILLIKMSLSDSVIFKELIVFLKLLSYIIFSSNYNLDVTIKHPSIVKITNLYRKITFYNWYNSSLFSFKLYYSICIVYYIIQIRFIVHLLYLMKKLRKHSNYNKEICSLRLNRFCKYYIYLQMMFSQHINEILSIVFFYVCEGGVFKIILSVVNSLFFLINVYLSYLFFIVNNSPFILSKNSLRLRHFGFYLTFLFGEILFPFHYVENYIKNKELLRSYKGISFFVVLFNFLGIFLFNAKKFEIETKIHNLLHFMVSFSFFSIIIEMFLYHSDQDCSNFQLFTLFLLKIFFTFLICKMYFNYKTRFFIHAGCKYLFSSVDDYNNKTNEEHIEALYYLLSLVDNWNSSVKYNSWELNYIIDVVISHTNNCKNKLCKCHYICVLNDNPSFNEESFRKKTTKAIGVLIETSLVRSNFLSKNNMSLAAFLSEFYLIIQNNIYLSYSVLQSNICLNSKKYSLTQSAMLYSLFNIIFTKINSLINNNKKFIKFYKNLDNVYSFKKFNHLIINLCANYIDIINIKDSIESTLKFEHDEDTHEITKISSKYLTKNACVKLATLLNKQHQLYLEIKNFAFNIEYNQSNLQYYFIVFIFFRIFRVRIPNVLLTKFSKLSVDNEYSYGTSEKEAMTKFERILSNFFKKLNNNTYHIIIKCKKNMIIKSISSQLVNFLNFKTEHLLDEPLDTMFPPFLKNIHNKCMISYLSKNKNSFFLVKSTNIFDSNYNMIPCKIKAALLPHMCQSLFIVCNIEVHYKPNLYSFYLNDSYETLTISRSINRNLFFSLEMIKKYDINLLEIFDVQPFTLKSSFKDFETEALQYINNIHNNPKEFIIQTCYSLSHNQEDDKSLSKLVNPLNLGTVVNSIKKKNLNSPTKTEKILRGSIQILSNLINTLNKLSDLEVKNDYRSDFNEVYIILQNKLTELTMTIHSEDKKYEPFYPFIITGKVCYTIPLYLVESPLKVNNINVVGASGITTHSSQVKKFSQSHIKKFSNMSNSFSHQNGDPYNQKIKVKKKSTIIEDPTSLEDESGNKKKYNKYDKCLKIKKYLFSRVSRYSFKISVFLVLILLGFSLFILIFLFISYTNLNLISSSFFLNRFQSDKIVSMISTFFTISFHLFPITTSPYEFEIFATKAIEHSYAFQFIFRNFYSNYVKYNMKTGLSFGEITMDYTLVKLSNDWTNQAYNSNFIEEMGMIYYNAFNSIMDFSIIDPSTVREDLLLIFGDAYKTEGKDHKITVQTKFGKFLFYIIQNTYTLLNKILMGVETKIKADFEKGTTLFKFLDYLAEGLFFFCYSFFFIWILLFLHRYNTAIFGAMMSVFSFKEGNNISNKNVLHKQTMGLFINLLQNFNESNFLLLREKKNEKRVHFNLSSQTQIDNNQSLTINSSTNTSNTIQLSSTISSGILLKNSSQISPSQKQSSKMDSLIHVGKKSKNKIKTAKLKYETVTLLKQISSVFNVQKLNVILYFQIIVFILYLIFCYFSLLRLTYSCKYISNMTLAVDIFEALSQKYGLSFQTFTMIRIFILKNNPTHLASLKASNWINAIKTADQLLEEKIGLFKTTNKIRRIYQTKISDLSNNQIIEICSNSTFCINEISKESGYCSGGISLCLENALHKSAQLISDLTRNKTFDLLGLYQYMEKEEINQLENTLEFVLSNIQDYVYNGYFNDSDSLRVSSQNHLNIINILSFIFQFISSFLIVMLLSHILNDLHSKIVLASFQMNCFMIYKG